MHILHLEASPGWGGQEIRIFREMTGMQQRGHHVALAAMRGAALAKQSHLAGFPTYELNFNRPGWPLALFQLISIIRKHRIDLINTHSSLDAWLGGIAARCTGKKVVRTRHLSTPIKPGWNSRILYNRLADFVVTTCASIIPMISEQSGKPLALCRSVPTGIDPDAIRVNPEEKAAFRTQYGIAPETFLVGTACFMRSWKGIQDLLQAAHQLRDLPDLQWVIIGGGHAETYQKMAQALDIQHKVIFTGHLDNPFPAIDSLDAFTLLSTAHEGVSQAILQAAYLGKPLIATTTGGLGEVCVENVTGIRVDPFSPDQVAKAVLKLKDQPSLRLALGCQAKKWVEEHFSWQATLDQMEEIFCKIGIESNC